MKLNCPMAEPDAELTKSCSAVKMTLVQHIGLDVD
jgi:hypothetical protein